MDNVAEKGKIILTCYKKTLRSLNEVFDQLYQHDEYVSIDIPILLPDGDIQKLLYVRRGHGDNILFLYDKDDMEMVKVDKDGGEFTIYRDLQALNKQIISSYTFDSNLKMKVVSHRVYDTVLKRDIYKTNEYDSFMKTYRFDAHGNIIESWQCDSGFISCNGEGE